MIILKRMILIFFPSKNLGKNNNYLTWNNSKIHFWKTGVLKRSYGEHRGVFPLNLHTIIGGEKRHLSWICISLSFAQFEPAPAFWIYIYFIYRQLSIVKKKFVLKKVSKYSFAVRDLNPSQNENGAFQKAPFSFWGFL